MMQFLRKAIGNDMWKNNTLRKQDGLSLLETTVLLLVLGLLLLPILHLQTINRKFEVVETTTANIDTVRNALRQYAMRNGRYPRPAQRNLNENSAAFGQETPSTGAAIGNCAGDDATPCRVTGARDPDDTGGTNGPYTDGVLIGDIPFAEIGIPQHFMIDGWGSKFTYAISEGLTDTNLTFNETFGVIKVVEFNQTTNMEGTEDNAHFVVVSHGDNQRGAWSISGQLIAPCDPGTPAQDVQNCDYNNDATFTNNHFTDFVDENGNQQQGTWRSYANNAEYYDDYIGYDISINGRIWSKNNTNASAPDIFSRNVQNIRIGSIPDFATLQGLSIEDAGLRASRVNRPLTSIEVLGDVVADEIHANTLCSHPGAERYTSDYDPYRCYDNESIMVVEALQKSLKESGSETDTFTTPLKEYAKLKGVDEEEFDTWQSEGFWQSKDFNAFISEHLADLILTFDMVYNIDIESLLSELENENGDDIPPLVFDPSIIGGEVNQNGGDDGTNANKLGGGIYCGDLPLVGIKAANEICDKVKISGTAANQLTNPCPVAGTFLRGVRPDGTMMCCLPGEVCQ